MIYAGEDVLAWGKGERVYAQRSDCLKEVEAIAIERGVRFGPASMLERAELGSFGGLSQGEATQDVHPADG